LEPVPRAKALNAPCWPLRLAQSLVRSRRRQAVFFAGIRREWRGDVGTIKEPNVGLHRLYSILTTEPNGVVQPIHDKAMPVMLMTAEDVDVWLNGMLEEALKLQKPSQTAPSSSCHTTRRRRLERPSDARTRLAVRRGF
jgi:putative SOS response-associated peptidase YedK